MLARMALAALDSEPVAWTWQHLKQWHVTNDEERARDLAWDGVKVEPLYRHAQPVLEIESEPVFTLKVARAYYKGQKLGNHFGFITLDAARELKEGNYQLYTAQPAPVVPEEMTIRDACKFVQDMRLFDDVSVIVMRTWNACRAAMLAAAPQSPGSEPATMPGKWIPASEQMPPSRHEVLVGRWWGEKPRWCCKWATYIPGHPDAQSSGWLIPGGSWTPTHWMELPGAPQEAINALIPLVSRNEQEVK
ncbi:DUF551 domain-containing protein [Klebsiella variicola]|uniref:DUF551 domain-containing protein n=1 Tax=Klebsiella variicola TaxID=244366 RepID=UPI003005AC12